MVVVFFITWYDFYWIKLNVLSIFCYAIHNYLKKASNGINIRSCNIQTPAVNPLWHTNYVHERLMNDQAQRWNYYFFVRSVSRKLGCSLGHCLPTLFCFSTIQFELDGNHISSLHAVRIAHVGVETYTYLSHCQSHLYHSASLCAIAPW